MGEVRVREAKGGDAGVLLALMREAAPELQEEVHPSITEQVLKESGCGSDKPVFRALLAEEVDGSGSMKAVVGFAVSHHLYSTWEGHSFSLRHLYVAPSHRLRGIGTKLWRAIIKAALDEDCIRCDCFIPESNVNGSRFCVEVGGMQDWTTSRDHWHLFRIEKEAMEAFLLGVKSDVSGVKVRPASRQDMVGVWQLIQELADYEKMPDGPRLDAKAFEQHTMDGNPPWCQCWVAEDVSKTNTASEGHGSGKKLVGYVVFFHLLSCEGRGVYMEDLYVSPSYRGRGIGQAMWGAVMKAGLTEGATLCEFEVLEWNEPSIAFYKKKGAINMSSDRGYHIFRMDHSQMVKFVES